jgi:CYTH domain-containing protein
MAKEIERKYLVKTDGWRSQASSSSSFLQAYIASGKDRSVRVRIMDDTHARLTIKIGRDLFARDEFEYDVPLADAREMSSLALGVVLEKTRYKIPFENYVWEVDVYAGAYQGLVVAEVEIGHEKEQPAIPDWIGQEITGDRRYSNLTMATEDLSEELLNGLSFKTG